LNATAIPGFLKYPGLLVEKTRVSGRKSRLSCSGKPGWKHWLNDNLRRNVFQAFHI